MVFSKAMRRRSTIWFALAGAWFVLLAVDLLHHRDLNSLVMGIAVAVFLVIGLIFRGRDRKTLGSGRLK